MLSLFLKCSHRREIHPTANGRGEIMRCDQCGITQHTKLNVTTAGTAEKYRRRDVGGYRRSNVDFGTRGRHKGADIKISYK